MGAFEAAEGALSALIASVSASHFGDSNEATTRLRLIDRLLFECLGWDRADSEAEQRLDDSYADYAMSAPYRVLIVEAKREGVYFNLPAGEGGTQISIAFFRRHNKAVYAAIEQCARYCQARGTSVGAVTNGHQIVAFLATRSDGVPPLEGDALVFPSLESMRDKFLVLWNALSRPGLRQQGLLRQLLGATVSPPDKLSARISGYPGFKNRNTLQTNLEILGDLVIEDLARMPQNEAEFLRSCYSPSGALAQYALVSRRILEARYSTLIEQSAAGPTLRPAVTKYGIDPELLAQSMSRRPVLLVGDVGAGKTMFIRHFIHVDAQDLLKQAIVLYLDLGSQPTFTSDLEGFVASEIARQLQSDYHVDLEEAAFVRGVHHGDLIRFARGIYGKLRESNPKAYAAHEIEFLAAKIADKNAHLKASLDHLVKARRQQIVIFLDNVDQRPYELQQQAFLIANGMATTWPATVFIALRPETFHRSRLRGTLSAYHLKAFTVSPPRLDRVIEKRLAYTIELLARGGIGSLGGVGLDAPSLNSYLQVLRYSFQQNRELVEFGENMCGGNIRLALDFMKTFIGSGHVNTQKILDIQARSGRYLVPLHEFLRAVIYGDNAHFDPGSSEIVNVFDVATNDRREHFAIPLVLGFLDRVGKSQPDGFVSIEDAHRFAQDLAFTPAQAEWAVGRCLVSKLAERPARTVDTEDTGSRDVESSYLRVTSAGMYYARRMVSNFNYVDAMIVDTPVMDGAARAEIQDVAMVRDRLDRAGRFQSYLDNCWYDLDREDLPWDWPTASHNLGQELSLIRSLAH